MSEEMRAEFREQRNPEVEESSALYPAPRLYPHLPSAHQALLGHCPPQGQALPGAVKGG